MGLKHYILIVLLFLVAYNIVFGVKVKWLSSTKTWRIYSEK